MVVDKLGQEIAVGSYIAYPYMHGYSTGLRIGKVTATRTKPHKWKEGETDTTVTVIGIDDHYGGKPELLSKKSTLQSVDKIVVLKPEQISANYKVLLDNYN
jgi:hypothetical protein